MAEIPYGLSYEMSPDGGLVRCFKWSRMKSGDVGQPFHMPVMADRSVQFGGSWGDGGAKVQMQGTNMPDTPEWLVLTNTLGALIESVTSKLHQIVEVCHAMRPAVVAGDGSESVDVYIYLISRRG